MDIVERLTLEAAEAETVLACEHRHRYEFAAGPLSGTRVLDLCCGSGYGSAILASRAQQVVGVDNDQGTVDTAAATVGRQHSNLSFELADAVKYLDEDLGARFDTLVCFEGLEHLHDLEGALRRLREHAENGLRILASIPNDKLSDDRNPFHVTQFGYEEAMGAFASFPAVVMVPQFLAEGSLILPPETSETDVALSLDDREPEYANHFLFLINFDADEVGRANHGRMHLSVAPIFNRWSEGLKHANRALRRENARLARARLGKAGSAAASALAGLTDREAQIEALVQRSRASDRRIAELEAALADGGRGAPGRDVQPPPVVGEASSWSPAALDPGDDPNSWESRRRRAAEFLVPWIEQTVDLSGKTVLEYGCGNAAVSCAFAARAERVIGVDIDPDGIGLGNEEISKRELANVELSLHPLDAIMEAVAGWRGQVDVFLLYAVLEHLTVQERLAVLQLAREVVDPEGAIVVCETPNRLIYFDHHTAQMPFFHLLPDELAADYYPRSARRDFTDAIDDAAQGGSQARQEAITRWGRGVSFHEFEVVFGDLSRHVVASNYDPILFPERPPHPDEVILARYLERWRPDLAPVWSRYWLDLILSPQAIDARPPFLRPWMAETVESRNVGWTREESMHLRGPDATLWVSLPHPTQRLVVGTARHGGLVLTVRVEDAPGSLAASVDAAPDGQTIFSSFVLADPTSRIGLDCSDECDVVFVGFDD